MILDEEVKPIDILNYFEAKYKSPGIVTQRTIQNWLKVFEINCIQPRPPRNADIRYRKSDVLKLEGIKKEYLLKKQHQGLWEKQKNEILEKELKVRHESFEEYGDYLAKNAEGQYSDDLDISLSTQADAIIKSDMIIKCFEKLYPTLYFDKKELVQKLHDADFSTINSKEEKGEAINYIDKKLYIKEKK